MSSEEPEWIFPPAGNASMPIEHIDITSLIGPVYPGDSIELDWLPRGEASFTLNCGRAEKRQSGSPPLSFTFGEDTAENDSAICQFSFDDGAFHPSDRKTLTFEFNRQRNTDKMRIWNTVHLRILYPDIVTWIYPPCGIASDFFPNSAIGPVSLNEMIILEWEPAEEPERLAKMFAAQVGGRSLNPGDGVKSPFEWRFIDQYDSSMTVIYHLSISATRTGNTASFYYSSQTAEDIHSWKRQEAEDTRTSQSKSIVSTTSPPTTSAFSSTTISLEGLLRSSTTSTSSPAQTTSRPHHDSSKAWIAGASAKKRRNVVQSDQGYQKPEVSGEPMQNERYEMPAHMEPAELEAHGISDIVSVSAIKMVPAASKQLG
ncbi:hypothetical protein M501DRAFT_1021060 [Patellaria atrata CBS 101060]|uniref:Uncharacterized protein n=1 Tax=Patellaria atrata CBS 101060 TaxID=1346257 RepID=A0A9P4S2J4_9PEZI|nr:hypothetical protein M501DRAFT_1021060 [Patellaria atrata CBS 101060]